MTIDEKLVQYRTFLEEGYKRSNERAALTYGQAHIVRIVYQESLDKLCELFPEIDRELKKSE